MRVILITGSRSFEGHKDIPFVQSIKDQAFHLMCEELWNAAKGGHRVFIIGGEAKGPDTWAWDFVQARIKTAEITGVQCMWGMEQYRCDGIAYQIPSGNKFRWSKGGVNPLARNLKLVEVASSMMKAHEVKALAIRDRRSGPPEKGGTMHTLRHAKEAGIRGQLIEV